MGKVERREDESLLSEDYGSVKVGIGIGGNIKNP